MYTICVYRIVNKQNGRMYIGSTTSVDKRFNRHKRELRRGTHHCTYLQRSWNKYGEENFSFEIVKQYDSEISAREEEQRFLEENYDVLYNVSRYSSGGDLISYHPNREAIVEKMTNSVRNRYSTMTVEERKLLHGHSGTSNPNFGRKHTEEARRKMSMANKGNQHAKGSKRTKEQKDALSKLASQRVGEKNPFFGKKHSEETKRKIAETKKGSLPVNSKPVSAEGVTYPSATAAAKSLGCVTATVLNRIKSDKFPTYMFLDA
ncbi:homing endonuclease [Bacillus phage Bobb]|uniref:GIY-YIG domain-containing protein n=1 Tax=Bacillus phage Bobb TaxID=1527469 RepID=A0A076G735_9CAUD|nr:homing endonuclease [Bacillus phage Bobb]AII28127.1 hypothetical protein [Bacillus phage Bobb]